MNDSSRDKQRHLVGVYGTLKGMDRPGRRWGDKQNPIDYLGRAYTLFPSFTMHGGAFPVVNRVLKGTLYSGRVLCEIYEVSTDTLRALDAYEGAPTFYEAEPVAFQMETDGSDCVALMYLGVGVNATLKSRPIIMPSSEVDPVLHWPYPSEYAPEAL